MNTTLKLTSITNFILSSLLFTLFGWQLARCVIPLSAAGFWTAALFFIALSSFLGGIDHGFFESAGNTPARLSIQRATWVSMAIFSGLLLETAIIQFMPANFIPVASAVTAIYTIYYITCSIAIGKFRLVLINYIPALLLFIILVLFNADHFPGWWQILTGMILAIIASVIQVSRVSKTLPFDHNCWYHVIMLPSSIFLALGGVSFNLF